MIEKEEKVFISNSQDICNQVLKKRVEDYAQRGTIKIVKTKIRAKVLSFKTADDFAKDVLYFLFNGNEKDLIKISEDKKEKNPLFLFLKKEVVLYAKLKGIKGKIKKDSDKMTQLLNKMEKKHPEVKNAMMQSYIKYYLK